MAILERTDNATTPLTNTIGRLQARTAKSVGNAQTKAALLGSRAQVKLMKASNLTRDRIHQKPILSVLAGIGAGVLVGSAATFLSLRTLRAAAEKHSTRKR